MSVLAHPGPISLPTRRRHLTVVPARPSPESERLADVIALPLRPPAIPPAAAAPAPAVSRPVEADAPLRLTARGRAVLAGLAVLAAVAVGSVAGAVAGPGEPTGAVEVVTVSSGDTLWSIAASVAAPGEDVRDVMSEIAALNDLEGAAVVAGQRLTVPGEG